jgi:protease-4
MTKGSRIGLIIVLLVMVSLIGIGFVARRARQPETGSVLELVLNDDIGEQSRSEVVGDFFGGRRLTTRDYVEALLRARQDKRINGLLLTIKTPSIGLAKIQELRDAIHSFQESGKWTVAWSETVGEFSPGTGPYYLATACDTIWIAPSGDVNLTGLRAEVPFIRGILDRLKVKPDMDHIGKYKNAMNYYTDKAMNEPFREALEAILDSVYRQLRQGIAAGRHMTDDEVAALIDQGPFIGPRALEAKLVDHLGYRDELETWLTEKNHGRLPIIKGRRYLKAGRYWDKGTRIALIYGVGGVHRGESSRDLFSGSESMGSDTVAAAIKEAREDDSIKAIVFRVDSPGGSYVASDIIWREVMLTKGKKPIVVSMSDVAGSGGYFVAIGADAIVAEPGTLTASIGVLSGKLVTKDLLDWVGYTTDSVQRGRHATFYSTSQMYSPEERAIFKSWLDRVYKDFVGKVAQGRGKTFEEIDAIAQGRVWSGEDALRLGLVDELGGLETAVNKAAKLAGIGTGPIQLVEVPAGKSLLQEYLSRDEDAEATMSALREQLRSVIEEGRLPVRQEQVLEMPFVPRIN